MIHLSQTCMMVITIGLTLTRVLPSVPAEMVDSIVHLFKTDSNFFHQPLKRKCFMELGAESPMQICYCKADEEVFHKNALVCMNT